MDLQLQDKQFIIGGASSGLGNAIAKSLLEEGAAVIGFARNLEAFQPLLAAFPNRFQAVAGDVTGDELIPKVIKAIDQKSISGILLNSGGPPATAALETTLSQWDEAYRSVFRWKVDFVQQLLPFLKDKKNGRIVFLESVSIKQAVPNLVLSNALRMAIAGYAKTLSQEVGHWGITVNILAPGFHNTRAAERVFHKRSETEQITYEAAVAKSKSLTAVNAIGEPNDFASLAAWLFSPYSRYVTGQILNVEGGLIKGVV